MDQTANPTIFKNPIYDITAAASPKGTSNWFKKNFVKIIIVVLVLAVALELVFGGMTLFSPQAKQGLNVLGPKVNPLTQAFLSLVPEKNAYKTGDQVIIDVKLFTGGYTTDSTDLVIKYDPAFLEPAQSFAKPGNLYSEYPALQVDKQSGLIGISGITLPGSNSFSGVGTFAKLEFKALKIGQTGVSIDFAPQATNDSNVVLSGSTQDILGDVLNADILISETGEGKSAEVGQSCQSFTQYCQDGQGNTGTQVCSGGSIKAGSCGYDPQFTISCEVCKK